MTTLTQLSESQAQKAVTVNDNFVSVSPAGLFGYKAATSSGLTWGYFGGRIDVDGVSTSISDGTLTLTNGATNYIEATRAGVVSKNTSAFTPGSIPLYTAVTSGSVVTTLTDYRELHGRKYFPTTSVAVTSADVTLTYDQARVELIRTTGVLTGNRSVIVPAVKWLFVADNANSGAFTTTFKTAAGSGVAVTQGTRALLYCDGTNVISALTDYVALGLGTMALQNANAVAITGGTITGTTFNNGVIGGVTPAAGTFTSLNVNNSAIITGDLTVNGDFITANVATIEVEDPLIKLALGNVANSVDIGLYGQYQPAATVLYGGLFRDATDGVWKLFDSLQEAPTATVNTSGTGYAAAALTVGALTASGVTTDTIVSAGATATVFNTVATTVNAFGAATALNIGNASGTTTILGNTLLSANTAGNALEIRQLGAGNAIFVEDSTNPDATPFLVDASGNVVSGHTAALTTFLDGSSTPRLQIVAAATPANFGTARFSTSAAAGPAQNFGKSNSGTIGTYTAVTNGHLLGVINFSGSDDTDFALAAKIEGFAAETFTSSTAAGHLRFSTTPTGSHTPTEAFRINAVQNLAMVSGAKFYFDGVAASGDTYIAESSANVLDLTVGAATSLSLTATTATFIGSITTSAPTGGAGAWELGIANSVSPTAPNRTVTIEIGGTAYYLAAKTTND